MRSIIFIFCLLTLPLDLRCETLPGLAQWESQMQQWGKFHGDQLLSGRQSFDQALDSVYYDGQYVFLRIYKYTGDTRYLSYANKAGQIYRDQYVLPSRGFVQGFRSFTDGLRLDWDLNKNAASRAAALSIAGGGAFTRPASALAQTISADYSREVAYGIENYLDAQALGARRQPRLAAFVRQAFGHLNQWFGSGTRKVTLKPFMVGLTARALIKYHTQTRDARVLPALKRAADVMWREMWVPQSMAFRYADRNSGGENTNPAPDLNLLIAPMYEWIYRQTGIESYRSQGDAIFLGGVRQAYLGGGKQFNQNYRWSFDYVNWRMGQNRSS